jgi:hypothetical protein
METRTIPEEHWIEFFDRFSQDHVGWPVTIEVQDAEHGPQKVAQGLPLLGISFDTKGTRPSSIEIIAGSSAGTHVEHVIDMPLHIRKAQEDNGDIDVQIEPARGPVTLIHLSGPLH